MLTPFLWMLRYRFRLVDFMSLSRSLGSLRRSTTWVCPGCTWRGERFMPRRSSDASGVSPDRAGFPLTGSTRTNQQRCALAWVARSASARSNASGDSASGP
ncbi:hypothetical protein ACJ65_00420 [Kocuria rhizophila]|nr:hypothetical protein ACJ65_00420 [Kocuria rhizophila]